MELSVNYLIGLYKMVALGKATGGLIHNINGPLQNIGLDLEMSQYMLRKDSENNGGIESNIMMRLKRIEDELERLNNMIKISSNKILQADSSLQNFNEYIEQELAFLHTNLYFKHNVETSLQLDSPSPLISRLSENSVLAFSWLLQIVIEEIEDLKANRLLIRTVKEEGSFNIYIESDLSRITDLIKQILENANLDSNDISAQKNDPELMLILKIFNMEGISFKIETDPGPAFLVSFPLGN